ncbi:MULTISPECIES: TetR/AcrR family transcriptional regulator [Streptomyces]|uniref:TetR/AcrR family transcriptional regulator n=1 Tax=Streptomyces lonegramiae TaxID=3075524 RepID=A0ABU2XIH2_9ACTN|nr:TetR/AcrR family transcriptional regulator [Streptomyces sp. DSM 41529]MDT0545622.1 TetR/AcrR family transcriptional regulator [Streptomyces sp. DSM 41529]
MTRSEPSPSPRRQELLEAAYAYALRSGLGELSLRPLAEEIRSSPRVLLYLFGSKDGLIRALLARARADELAHIQRIADSRNDSGELRSVARELWRWLSDEAHRGLLTLWVESYARSLTDPDGPWAGFARDTVDDWLELLAAGQPAALRDTEEALAQRTLVLAVLRGALLDLLATGDAARTTAAVHLHLEPARMG